MRYKIYQDMRRYAKKRKKGREYASLGNTRICKGKR